MLVDVGYVPPWAVGSQMARFCGISLLIGAALACGVAHAQCGRDSVRIFFRQGYSVLDLSLGGNGKSLDDISDALRARQADSTCRIRKVAVVGGASPEGSVPLNEKLSRKRAAVLFSQLAEYVSVPDSARSFEYLGRDWGGLLAMVEADGGVPYKDETISLIRDIIAVGDDGVSPDGVRRMAALRGGEPWRYMYGKFFPELRASRVVVSWDRPWDAGTPAVIAAGVESACAGSLMPALPREVKMPVEPGPFYAALKTNMLYDALLIPNAGAEVYLGGGWSIGAGWTHAWWRNDRRYRYWRIYGADAEVRRWFGEAASRKPLTGHHAGIYAQALTYDFETGGRGFLGGQPGGTLADRATWGIGAAYGYSMPLARRLNIDFVMGVGAHWGRQHEYLPEDGCYVWQATRMKRWFGPTRAEVSLTWLIGRGNVNPGKGGAR